MHKKIFFSFFSLVFFFNYSAQLSTFYYELPTDQVESGLMEFATHHDQRLTIAARYLLTMVGIFGEAGASNWEESLSQHLALYHPNVVKEYNGDDSIQEINALEAQLRTTRTKAFPCFFTKLKELSAVERKNRIVLNFDWQSDQHETRQYATMALLDLDPSLHITRVTEVYNKRHENPLH